MKCEQVVYNPDGSIKELLCKIDPETKGANPSDGRKIKATIHWVSAVHAIECEARLYDHLFVDPDPDRPNGRARESGTYLDSLNPNSHTSVRALVEPSVQDAKTGDTFQFERIGYFCVDPDTRPGAIVFNRIVTLRDTWAKIEKKSNA